MKEKIIKEIFDMSIYILLAVIISFLILTFVGQRTPVDGSSMEPTLSDGDQLILDKLSYRFNDPKRFDIIVFPYYYEEKSHYIKRIIGLPGETVFIDPEGNIYIDGELLHETYGLEVILDAGRANVPVVLGEDEYFVMGDNRNNSHDSRYEDVGNIQRSQINGRAWARIWPFSEFGRLKHQ